MGPPAKKPRPLPRVTAPEASPADIHDDPGPTRAVARASRPRPSAPEVDSSLVYDDPGPTRAVPMPKAPPRAPAPAAEPSRPLTNAISTVTEPAGPAPYRRRGSAALLPPSLPKVTAAKPAMGAAREVTGRTRAVPRSRVLAEIEQATQGPRPSSPRRPRGPRRG